MKDEICVFERDSVKFIYTLIRRERKTIGITIELNGDVRVFVPRYISKDSIEKIIELKSEWIIKKLQQVKQMNLEIIERKFVSGEKLLYLGQQYILRVLEYDLNRAKVGIENNSILVYIPKGLIDEDRKKLIKHALVKWYRDCFCKICKERIQKYAVDVKASPLRIAVKNQKTRWGSCSEKGNINLNWRLIMAPMDIIDYVIVHELCHLRVMNHSKNFWSIVESILPNYLERKKWLKNNGYKLII